MVEIDQETKKKLDEIFEGEEFDKEFESIWGDLNTESIDSPESFDIKMKRSIEMAKRKSNINGN